MSTKMDENIQLLLDYSQQVDNLASALNAHVKSYEHIQDILHTVQAQERDIKNDIDVISAQVHQNVVLLHDWQTDAIGNGYGELTAISEELSIQVKETKQNLEASSGILAKAVEDLNPQLRTISAYSETLAAIQERLYHLPELMVVSGRLQQALGVLSGAEELTVISQKLEEQLVALHQEREEIIQPLKNAAAFSKVVKEENRRLLEEVCTKVDQQTASFDEIKIAIAENTTETAERFGNMLSTSSDSIDGKLNEVLRMLQELQAEATERSALASEPGGLRGIFGLGKRPAPKDEAPLESLQELWRKHRPFLMVVKKHFNNDFVFVYNKIENGQAIGKTYRAGNYFGEKTYPATEQASIYTGPSVDKIVEDIEQNHPL